VAKKRTEEKSLNSMGSRSFGEINQTLKQIGFSIEKENINIIFKHR
jgi:hypothetical protein